MTNKPINLESVKAAANALRRKGREMSGYTSIGDDAANRAIIADADALSLFADLMDNLASAHLAQAEEIERLRERVKAAFQEGFDMAAGLTPHVHEVMERKNDAWRKSRALAAYRATEERR